MEHQRTLSRVARRVSRIAFAFLVASTLTGCGFELRGTATLPFKTIAVPGETQLGTELQRSIDAGTNAKVVPQSENPQAILALLGETRDKLILTLNAQGQVTEYELRYRGGNGLWSAYGSTLALTLTYHC